MATVLKNSIAVTALAPATPTAFAHGLNLGPLAVFPDLISLGDPDLTFVSADDTNVTLRNDGAAPITTSVYVEHWHSFDRAIPAGITNLTPQPIVVGGSGAGGGSIAEPRTDFVYRPGDPSGARQNVYTDWATMFAAIATVEGSKTVLVDGTFATTSVPVGTWDLTDVEVVGSLLGTAFGAAAQTVLEIVSGAVLTSAKPGPFGLTIQQYCFRNILLDTSGPGPAITLTGATTVGRIVMENASLGGTPGGLAGIIVGVVAPIVGAIIAMDRSIIDDPTTAAVDVGPGATLNVFADDASVVDDNITGTGTLVIEIRAGDVTLDPMPSFGGAVTFNNREVTRWTIPAVGPGPGLAIHNNLHRFDTTAGPVAFQLPASSPDTAGQSIGVKKIVAEAVNAVGVMPLGGDTILGPSSSTSAFGAVTVVDNGDGTWSTTAVI